MDMVATGTATATTLTFAKDTYPEQRTFDRFINGTAWDRTNRWALLGPTARSWTNTTAPASSRPGRDGTFRQVGNLVAGTYRLWPPPATVDTPFQIAWEYISLNWVRVPAATLQGVDDADDDTPLAG
jgi:hypothetical protein